MHSSGIAHQTCLPWWCSSFIAIAAPISWKKVQFQDSLVWCGWEINFSHDTIQLMSSKLGKLDALIKSLLGSRRALQDTRAVHRPADLGHQHCPTPLVLAGTTLRGPQQPTRLHALNTTANMVNLSSILDKKNLKTSHSLPGLWIIAGSKILEISGRTLHCV